MALTAGHQTVISARLDRKRDEETKRESNRERRDKRDHVRPTNRSLIFIIRHQIFIRQFNLPTWQFIDLHHLLISFVYLIKLLQ